MIQYYIYIVGCEYYLLFSIILLNFAGVIDEVISLHLYHFSIIEY